MTKQLASIRYYDKTDKQKKNHLSYVKRKIVTKSRDSSLYLILRDMMAIADKTLKNYHADFYVHDVEILEHLSDNGKKLKDISVLWVVRELGTHVIDLNSTEFLDDGKVWSSSNYFRSIVNTTSVKAFYLIENGRLKKLQKKSAFVAVAIKEDYAKTNLKVEQYKKVNGLL